MLGKLLLASAVPAVLAVSLLFASRSQAEEQLAAKYQALFFKKILVYDRTLKGRAVEVAVADELGGEDLVKAFADVGIAARVVKDLGASQASVVYVRRPTAALKEHCARNRVLSISDVVESAERGDVSIAVRRKPEGKPEIVVNYRRVKEEGHEFDSGLLGLVRVVR